MAVTTWCGTFALWMSIGSTVSGQAPIGQTPNGQAPEAVQRPRDSTVEDEARADFGDVEIRSLAEGSYADRQRATLEMWRLRDLSRQAVQDASRNADPEVAERAAWILKQWRSGALPGVGEVDPSLLLDRDSTSALAAVLEQGVFKAVLVAVEESAGTIEFDQIKQRVSRSLTERFPIYVDRAYAEGTVGDLMMLVDAVALNRNVATSSRDLKVALGIEPDLQNPLPSAAAVWDASEQSICRSMFAMLDGDPHAAVTFAEASSDPDALRIARVLASRWEEIATTSLRLGEQANDERVAVELHAWALAAASRCGNESQRQKAKDFLLDFEESGPTNDDATRWHALATHDEVDAAIDLLERTDPSLAATVAAVSSRYHRAASLCQADLAQIDSDLDAFIDKAIAEQVNLAAGKLSPAIERLYPLARLLAITGKPDYAYRIYRRLRSKETLISDYGQSLRERTLLELDLVNRHDWMVEFAVGKGENVASQRTRLIAALAFGTEVESFTRILLQLKLVKPRSTFRDRFQMTCQLFRGKPAEGFEREDFESLFESLLRHREVKRLRGRVLQVESVALDDEIIDMFLRQGQIDLAHRGLEILSRNGDLDATTSLATYQSEHGDSATANELWNRVASKAAQYSATNAVITLDHGLAYAKSVVGQWILAKRSGHLKDAEKLEQRIRLMLASPSLTFRKELAEFLRSSKQYRLAAEVYRDLTILSAYGGSESPDFFRVTVSFVGVLEDLKESDPGALQELRFENDADVKWSDLAIVGLLMTTLYDETGFVTIPLSVRKTFLQHAIDQRDRDLARRAIQQIQIYDPLNIDVGERMLPDLREAGLTDIADDAINRLFDRGLEHIAAFGTDSTALNNVAWAAAMNQVRLNEALELSQRAVMLQPDSVVFRDTLAEVLHLLDRTEEALVIESACLLDEPDEWHLHQQIEKYRKLLEE